MKRIAKEIWEWTVGLLAIVGLGFLLTAIGLIRSWDDYWTFVVGLAIALVIFFVGGKMAFKEVRYWIFRREEDR